MARLYRLEVDGVGIFNHPFGQFLDDLGYANAIFDMCSPEGSFPDGAKFYFTEYGLFRYLFEISAMIKAFEEMMFAVVEKVVDTDIVDIDIYYEDKDQMCIEIREDRNGYQKRISTGLIGTANHEVRNLRNCSFGAHPISGGGYGSIALSL